jgi:hypothetical protein
MKSEMQIEMDILGLIALLAPVALIISWYFYFTRMRKAPPSWRDRVTLLSLALTSAVATLWPLMFMLTPRADWGSGAGVNYQVLWVESWHTPILRTLVAALILAPFGRPRLIGPLAVASVGTAIFWLGSTMP